MNSYIRVSRRSFLAMAGTGTVGPFVLGVRIGRAEETANEFSPNAWLSIARNGETTIWLTKAEMGQGVYTALPMLVAEELDADWSRVRVVQAVVEPRLAEFFGTGGSSSMKSSWEPLRRAGAAAREILIRAAAERWNVPVRECETEPGLVIHQPSGRRTPYGTLVEAASRLDVPEHPKLKERSQYRLIGKRVPRLDTPYKVDGSAKFGVDVRVPGLLFAVVARCPVYGGKVGSFDAQRAKAVPGVRHVVPIHDVGIAVVADSTWAALQGRQALDIHWNEGPHADLDDVRIAKLLNYFAGRGVADRNDGDALRALKTCSRRLAATYVVPFVAHCAIETVNCTAWMHADKCEIWGPLQHAGGLQKEAAEITGLPLSSIMVHTTFLGGGFGRKAEHDFALEAVLLAKEIKGPVQLLWPREDDIMHDHFRPASRHFMSAGFDPQGRLSAWNHRIVAPSLRAQWDWGRKAEDIQRGLDKWATEGPGDVAYQAPNFRVDYVMAPTPIPVGAWRSVYASQTTFADECFVDELAVVLGKDPYAFRLDLLGNASPLHSAVLECAAREAKWGKPLPPGRARGIAVCKYGRSYAAQVAEVSIDKNAQVRVHRVVCAADCGIVVNPAIVEAQLEGSILYGLSAALKGEITFARGRCQQSNFHDAQILRFSEAPEVEVHLLKSDRPPSGVGEPAVPLIAPAVANAVSAALGQRVRQLPLTPARLKAIQATRTGKSV